MTGPGPGADLAFTWWGHASTTVELAGIRVVVDPVLVDRLVHLRRYATSPGRAAATADLLLVSHLHADHCHLPSLRAFSPRVPVVAPPGVDDLVRGLGFVDVRTAVPGAQLRLEVSGHAVEVAVLPASHDGRRHPFSRRGGVAVGFRVAAGGRSFWFPGDTGLRDDMAAVDPVDLALAPVGGWGPSLGAGHLDPREAAEAVRRVGAGWAVPVHWGTFWPVGLQRLDRARHHRLFTTPGRRFAEAVAGAGAGADAGADAGGGTRVVLAEHGERVCL